MFRLKFAGVKPRSARQLQKFHFSERNDHSGIGRREATQESQTFLAIVCRKRFLVSASS